MQINSYRGQMYILVLNWRKRVCFQADRLRLIFINLLQWDLYGGYHFADDMSEQTVTAYLLKIKNLFSR